MTSRISRRHLLGRAGVAALGTAGLGALAGSANADTRTLYVLDPGGTSQAQACGGGCRSCNACRLHAANSYFASATAADLHRAHPYCNCVVTAGPTVPDDTYITLFGATAAVVRSRADLRMRWVQDALSSAGVPPPQDALRSVSDAPPPADESLPPAPEGSPENPRRLSSSARVGVLDLRVSQSAPRRLHVLIHLRRPAHVHAQLVTSHGRSLERRSFHAAAGRTTHDFRVPNGVPPGTYHLCVTLRADGSGAERILARKVMIAHGKVRHTRAPRG